MDTTGIELIYPLNDPLTLGVDDYSDPILVRASGYGYGFRLDQVGWVQGDGVQEALDSRLLVRVRDNDAYTGTPAGQHPGTQRPGETIPALGIENRIGTDADTNALVDNTGVEPTGDDTADEGTYDLDAEPARPTSRRRTASR